jgi:tryptophanyl-tRNA synthetase
MGVKSDNMRILSGIQPTGELHIGNYLGAIKQWTELQKSKNLDKETGCIFIIVDLHSITIDYDPKQMQKNILSAAMDYLAAGIDPKKCIIFVQSQIKEHAELAWLLETITPIGELERMTQYKDKSKQNKDNINAGLLAYPVLMAADILLYKTTIVPVGDDQAQHVELTREIARKFNHKFGQLFPEPKTQLQKTGARIMSLADPSQKMSKSIPQGCIYLSDTPEIIREKIKIAVTDSGKEIKFDETNKPAISNLLTVYHLFSGKLIQDIEKEYSNKGYGEFKKDLAEVIIDGLKEFQENKKKFEKNPALIKKILAQGAKQAQKIAEETMAGVKDKMGLI